jgi:hypothetical protein
LHAIPYPLYFAERQYRQMGYETRSTSWRRLGRISAYLIVIASAAAVIQGPRFRERDEAPIGKFTSRQAIRAAEPIIWSLIEFEPGMVLVAEPAVTQHGDRYPEMLWTVYCRDSRGSDRATVTIDAETSRIRSASRLVSPQLEGEPSVKSSDSSRIALKWLAAFARDQGTSPWELRTAQPTDFCWKLQLENCARRAKVTVDRRNGTIWFAYLSR